MFYIIIYLYSLNTISCKRRGHTTGSASVHCFFFGIKSKNGAKNTSFSFPHRRQRIYTGCSCTLYNPRQYNNSAGNRESGSWPGSQHTPVHCIITFLPGLFQTEFAWRLSRADYTTLATTQVYRIGFSIQTRRRRFMKLSQVQYHIILMGPTYNQFFWSNTCLLILIISTVWYDDARTVVRWQREPWSPGLNVIGASNFTICIFFLL